MFYGITILIKNNMKRILLAICIIFISCEKESYSQGSCDYIFEIDSRLDNNTLQLSEDSWQTIHRISGRVSPVQNDYELTKVYWQSSHYWLLGDTLGWIYDLDLAIDGNNYIYVSPDTMYVTWFEGYEVPTINEMCYSTNDGEINIMFAPVQSMKEDTITITGVAHFADGIISEQRRIDIIIE
mgnify:FL=1